ncbi:hypothetical protein [Dubosiella muris]|uniref:hypothetical protein n=1 Tax=Dubosiella muris TaxID=3038133 RepID=UPI00241010EC|nr:hypothetical protein [Dubosiella muris]
MEIALITGVILPVMDVVLLKLQQISRFGKNRCFENKTQSERKAETGFPIL